jgi:hypothetical protein
VLGVAAESAPPTATASPSSSSSAASRSDSAPPGSCLEHEMHVSIASRRTSDPATERGTGRGGAARVYKRNGELTGVSPPLSKINKFTYFI